MTNILQLPRPRASAGTNDELDEQIRASALEKLARKQLGLPALPRPTGSVLSIEADRMADLIAARAERKHAEGGLPQETRNRLEVIKRRLTGTPGTALIVRFPRHRVVRTKTRRIQIQRAYRLTDANESHEERFRRAEFAVQFAADFQRRHRQ